MRWNAVILTGMLGAWGVGGVWGADTVGDGAAVATRGAGKLLFVVSMETTGIVGPLRADGTVDYVGALNEKYGKGVTAENNGFVAFLQAVGVEAALPNAKTRFQVLEMCGTVNVSDAKKWVSFGDYLTSVGGKEEEADRMMKRGRLELWERKDLPELGDYLTARQKQLDMVVEASKRPRWWRPVVSATQPEMLGASLPSTTTLREIGEALCARAMLHGKAGDFAGFMGDVMAVKQLARKVGGGPTLIERMVGWRLDSEASEAIGAAFGTGTMNEENCQALRIELRGLAALPMATEAVDVCERWTTLDTVGFVSKMKGSDLFVTQDALMLGPLNTIEQGFVDYNVVLRLANKQFDDVVAALRDPAWGNGQAKLSQLDKRIGNWVEERKKKNSGALWMDTDEKKEDYSLRVGKALLGVIIPDVEKAGELERRARMEGAMADVVVAAAEVRGRTGKWPTGFEGLAVPELKEMPRDIYWGDGMQSVHYVVTEKGLRLYSIGVNGKDDGGVNDKEKGKDDIVVGVGE